MIPKSIKNNYLSQTEINEQNFSVLEQLGSYTMVKERTLLTHNKNLRNKVFLVLKGYIGINTTTEQGNEKALYIIRSGYLFQNYETSYFSYNALTDIHLLQFETLEQLESVILKDIKLTKWYLQYFKTALRYMAFRIEDLLTKSAKERYLILQNRFPEMLKEVKSKHIATFLGITPNSLSRIKATFVKNKS